MKRYRFLITTEDGDNIFESQCFDNDDAAVGHAYELARLQIADCDVVVYREETDDSCGPITYIATVESPLSIYL